MNLLSALAIFAGGEAANAGLLTYRENLRGSAGAIFFLDSLPPARELQNYRCVLTSSSRFFRPSNSPRALACQPVNRVNPRTARTSWRIFGARLCRAGGGPKRDPQLSSVSFDDTPECRCSNLGNGALTDRPLPATTASKTDLHLRSEVTAGSNPAPADAVTAAQIWLIQTPIPVQNGYRGKSPWVSSHSVL